MIKLKQMQRRQLQLLSSGCIVPTIDHRTPEVINKIH